MNDLTRLFRNLFILELNSFFLCSTADLAIFDVRGTKKIDLKYN